MEQAMVKPGLDAALPRWHHRERHSVAVAATPERAIAAFQAVGLAELPLVRTLFRLRGLRGSSTGSIFDSMTRGGFSRFGDDVLVLVGKPWQPLGSRRPDANFATFAEPGYAKLAMDVTAADGRLSTETRIFLTDVRARRRFRVYWLVVRPFSGLIRRRWLHAAKRRAELPC